MVTKKKKKVDSKEELHESKIYAFLATFLSIIGFIIAILTKKDDEYVMFYAKQSLVLFIASLILGVIATILNAIPFIGVLIHWAVQIVILVLWIISWIYALSGEEKEVPVFGHFAVNVKL